MLSDTKGGHETPLGTLPHYRLAVAYLLQVRRDIENRDGLAVHTDVNVRLRMCEKKDVFAGLCKFVFVCVCLCVCGVEYVGVRETCVNVRMEESISRGVTDAPRLIRV